MVTREQLNHERFMALLGMVAEAGESPQGELPPSEYIRSLQQATELEHPRQVAKAHRESAGPPNF